MRHNHKCDTDDLAERTFIINKNSIIYALLKDSLGMADLKECQSNSHIINLEIGEITIQLHPDKTWRLK